MADHDRVVQEQPGYRVVLLLTLKPGAQEAFLGAYDTVRWAMTDVPGYLGDQLCRSTHDPHEWLITSQWRSAEDFLAWEGTPEHRDLAAPMMAAVERRRSLRYVVCRETAPERAGPRGTPTSPAREHTTHRPTSSRRRTPWNDTR